MHEAGFWAHAQVYDLQQAHASRVVARAPKAYGPPLPAGTLIADDKSASVYKFCPPRRKTAKCPCWRLHGQVARFCAPLRSLDTALITNIYPADTANQAG